MDHVLTSIAQDHPNGHIIVQGHVGARYIVSVDPEWIYLRAEGEPAASDLLAAFECVRQVHPLRDEQSLLFDAREFTGTIDWDAVSELHNLIDWKLLRRFSIAHLVRDSGFALIVKIIEVLFPEANHKIFRDEGSAQTWLQEECIRANADSPAQKSVAGASR